jgi:hypothetical protein
MSCGDVNATYGGTWLRVKTSGWSEHHPVWVEEACTNSNGDVVIHGVDATNGERVTLELYGRELNVIWTHPDMGFVNHGKHAFHHQRVMARQWKRGLRRSQVDTDIIGNRMAMLTSAAVDCDFNSHHHIIQVFSPQYPTFREAEAMVKGGEKFACAFSKEFALAAHPDYSSPLLQYKRWVVGVVDGGETLLNSTCQHLLGQLNKIIAR